MAEIVSDATQSTQTENPPTIEMAESAETLASEKETDGASKRERGEGEEENKEEVSKKPKVEDEPVKEAEVVEMKENEEEKPAGEKLGPKEFDSGEAMFNYFFKFLHYWSPNCDVNKVIFF